MTEVFNELSVIGAEMDEEDRVVYLLASLPDTYNTLVTALEANSDVPTMEIVTERLLHEERKVLERKGFETALSLRSKAMTTVRRKPRTGPKCHYCHKIGHIQRNCIIKVQKEADEHPKPASRTYRSHKANTVVNGTIQRQIVTVLDLWYDMLCPLAKGHTNSHCPSG